MTTPEKQPDKLEALQLLTDAFIKLKCDLKKEGIKESVIEDSFRRHAKTEVPCNSSRKSRFYQTQRFHVYGPLALICIVLSCLIGCAFKYLLTQKCLIQQLHGIDYIFRPISDCSECRGLTSIPVKQGISKRDFLEHYAFTGVPVLVKDAITSWEALNSFNFQFFKRLYDEHQGAYDITESNCQFFGYNTEFTNLKDAFNMPKERADYRPGEKSWYFGWSNCVQEIRMVLRNYYSKPYFLPDIGESSNIDWIFMGGAGRGAAVHIDNVNRPSWQAQIKGKKTWSLYPVPECEHVCASNLTVTMEKGDILAVDTNKWYHGTYIHPGEMSIAIGSEYD